ncbi:MAG: hypothetical protein QM710_13750 [Flavobacterium sp.]
MTHVIFNVLVSFFTLCFSVYMVYYTYKEPSEWFSTNLKGYIGGGFMIILSIMSIVGKFSLLATFIQTVRKLLHFKKEQSGIGIALFFAIIFLIFALTYYRPDKIQVKYQNISEDKQATIKLVSGCFLFYYAFTVTVLYLLAWLFRS